MRVFIERFDTGTPTNFYLSFTIMNGTSFVHNNAVFVSLSNVNSLAQLQAASIAALDTYLANHSYNRDDGLIWPFPDVAALNNAPQAAIANSTNNLPTNYNLLSGLLGIADGLNGANTAQNDMATKLNTLLAELRTLGLISA